MNKINIIYLHGYRDGRPATISNKVSTLIDQGFVVLTPEIPPLYDEVKSYLIDYIKSLNIGSDYFILVGTSLGGYWANEMSNIFKLPAILINPSCQPSITLSNYNNPLLTKLELNKFPDISPERYAPKILILAKGDEILDYQIAQSKFKGCCKIVIIDGCDHRFDSAPIADYAIELYNNLTGCEDI